MPKINKDLIKEIKTTEKGFLEIVTIENPNKEANFDLEILNKQDAVAGLVLNHEETHVLVTKQYRPGSQEQEIGFPAGIIDDEESALIAMSREFEEETRYSTKQIDVIKNLGSGYPSVGCSTEKLHYFVLKLKKNPKEDSKLSQDKGENVETFWMPIENVFEKLNSTVSQRIFLEYCLKEGKSYLVFKNDNILMISGAAAKINGESWY